jgi:hypothetical protein
MRSRPFYYLVLPFLDFCPRKWDGGNIACTGEIRNSHRILIGNAKERDHMQNMRVGRKQKWIYLKETGLEFVDFFIWLRWQPVAALVNMVMSSGSMKFDGIYLTEQLLASQRGLCFMQVVLSPFFACHSCAIEQQNEWCDNKSRTERGSLSVFSDVGLNASMCFNG